MGVAVSGDRACALHLPLGRSTYLFAVTHGFGSVDGAPTAGIALERLRAECERRARGERFRRALWRPETATAALLGMLGTVNGELYARSASHDDYVTAGCSLTAVLVCGKRAAVAHAGATAAYLAREGYVVALTQNDAVGEGRSRILTRSVGTQPSLDASVCSFTFDDGDALVLTDRRLRDEDDRRRLAARLHGEQAAGSDEHVLIVRYAGTDDREAPPLRIPSAALRIAACVAAAVSFVAAMLWVR